MTFGLDHEARLVAKEMEAKDRGSATPKPQADIFGTIRRREAGGMEVFDVLLDGGDDYTPCTCAVTVHHGDRVICHIVNHRAVVVQNLTVPSVNDGEYEHVKDVAGAADDLLDTIAGIESEAEASLGDILEGAAEAGRGVEQVKEYVGYSADAAKTIAQRVEDADRAVNGYTDPDTGERVKGAAENAAEARSAAGSALASAKAAAHGLSDVEKVVGTVNWIADHGRYVAETSGALVDGRIYYTRSGGGTTADPYRYEVVAAPDASRASSYYYLEIDESVQNFVNSHVWLDEYGLNVTVDRSGGSTSGWRIHEGTVDGTRAMGMYVIDPSGAVMGQFNADGITLGDTSGGNYATIDSDSFDIMHAAVEMAHFGYGEGNDANDVKLVAPYFTLGARRSGSAIGNYSVVEGINSSASGYAGHAEGVSNSASGRGSHAEGSGTSAGGDGSHAEGLSSHADASYPPGNDENSRVAIIDGSVAAHAEGYHTYAVGKYSHTQNSFTVAASEAQTALGKSNVIDSEGVYAVIVGNGSAFYHANGLNISRSNALAVRWDGNVSCGAVNHATSSTAATAAAKVATADNGFNLAEGSRIQVKFTAANSYTSGAITLNVNSTGAKTVYAYGQATSSTNLLTWAANDILEFIYNGAYWVFVDNLSRGALRAYPVGSIYISANSTSPAVLFGGTWERITGRFLLAATDGGSSGMSQAAGKTGGSANAVVPYHRHSVAKVSAGAASGGAHSHTLYYTSHKVGTSSSFNHAVANRANGTASDTGVGTKASEGAHTHDIAAHNTDYAGTSGNATNANIPPFLSVYMWKRTA